MKKLFIIFTLVLASVSFAQNTVKDIFSKKDIVWFGLNFSEAKMVGLFDQIGGAGESSGKDIKNKWMSSWNGLIIAEPKNFKLAEAFDKEDVVFDISSNERLNQAVNADNLMTMSPYEFKDAQKTVKSIVTKLTANEKSEGIGLVFIVETFNKSLDEAKIYVTLFDIKTKNILITEKIAGKPVGIGLRNFWAGAVKSVIKQVKSDYYKGWKSKN